MFSVSCGGTSCSSMGRGREAFGRWLWWWRWITPPQMMCCPAHISMNASLSHYLYIMATTPRRGQASSRLISPLTARPEEKWEARQSCSPLIHRHHLTPQPWIACSRHYMAFVIFIFMTQLSTVGFGALKSSLVWEKRKLKRDIKNQFTEKKKKEILGFCWKEKRITH